MDDKARLARNAYKRKWNKEHPDRVRTYQENYWKKKAAEAEPAMQTAAEATE